MGSREESIRPADEAVVANRVGDSITRPKRRASGFGWPGERVRAGLIAHWVKDRQKGTLGTAGNGRNSVAPDLRLSSGVPGRRR